MARRPVLAGGSLSPFGGGGVDFGAFDLGNSDRESSLILTRVEVAWEAGRATNDEYLAALKAYAGTLTTNTSQRINADARVEQQTYRVERDVLVSQIDNGSKTIPDLLAYDKGKLDGITHDSLEYNQRLNTYQATQSRYYQDLEKDVVRTYNDGKMTTAQLNAWYLARRNDTNLTDNPDIREAVDTRLHDLEGRLTSERDAKAVSDYGAGKMAPATFITYATAARARFVAGTTDYQDWTDKLNDAHDRSLETALLYRYDLSQQYAQLAKFVASSKAPAGSKGGTSTSKSTRVLLGADGQWHTVTTTSTKATPGHGPTALQQQAYQQRQIEVNDAKAQMAQIARKVAGVGGFVSTDTTINYYNRQLGKFAKGSQEWYAVQGKIDSLNDRKHQEIVLAKQGIRISYPKGGSSSSGGTSSSGSSGARAATGGSAGVPSTPRAAAPSDTANVNIDDFMRAVAHIESGGRYTARNKSSGAFGKYQIMPANWPGWAGKYLGDAKAPQSPENQEKVARAKFADLYHWLGDWRAVAHWWLTGGSNKDNHLNPNNWSSSSSKYVNNVMAGLGRGPVSGSSLKTNAGTSSAGGVKSNARPLPATKPTKAAVTKGTAIKEGPLRVVVGEGRGGKGSHPTALTQGANFPKNMDGEDFKKFYAQYEQAFKSGATEFSIDHGGTVTHYFIGDDDLERRDGMRDMDALRVNLFRERMSAYAGSPSEITAANQFDGAIEDAAKHELIILDTYEQEVSNGLKRNDPAYRGKPTTSTGTPEGNASPIASGIAMLQRTADAITDHMKLGDAAMKRGDITTAYHLYQLAEDLRGTKDEMIARYSAAGQNAVTAIEKAYGVNREEALGKDAAAQLQKDLDRLGAFGAELDAALGPEGSKVDEQRALLKNIVKKYPDGSPVFDSRGPGGQIVLQDNWHAELQAGGDLEYVQTPASGYDPQTGKQQHDIEGMVRVDYLSGNTTNPAYAKYAVGTVGYVLAADGVTRVPISGKTFTRRRPDGTDELWVEDPFHPGQWSSTPIAYRAPAGFKAIPGKNGETVFEFSGATTSSGSRVQPQSDGFTYHLALDGKTGTYVLFRSKPGGLFSPEVVDENLGSLADGSMALDSFLSAGFARDMAGLSANDLLFANLGSPFVGGNPQQYKQWRDNFQSPVMPPRPTDPQSLDAAVRGLASTRLVDPQSLDAATRGLAPTRPTDRPTGRPTDPQSLDAAVRGLAPLKPLPLKPSTSPRPVDPQSLDAAARGLAPLRSADPQSLDAAARGLAPTRTSASAADAAGRARSKDRQDARDQAAAAARVTASRQADAARRALAPYNPNHGK